MTRLELFAAVRQGATEAASEGRLPDFLAELERARAEAILSSVSPSKAPDRVLTVEQTAAMLGRSASWVYRRKAEKALPVTRLQGGGFGFSERALERWIASRTR